MAEPEPDPQAVESLVEALREARRNWRPPESIALEDPILGSNGEPVLSEIEVKPLLVRHLQGIPLNHAGMTHDHYLTMAERQFGIARGILGKMSMRDWRKVKEVVEGFFIDSLLT